MLEAIEKLLILQDRDRKILQLREELAHIPPQREEFQTKGASAQAQLEADRLRIKQLEIQRKEMELEVQTLKQRIERYSLQQFQTKKNEEYRALSHEIETCQKSIHEIEDRELEVMEQAEAAQKALALTTKTATAIRKIADEELAAMAARESNLEQQLATLEADREQVAAAVDPSARVHYERLLRGKGRNVVVGITNGVCGGCHMQLQRQWVVACKSEKEITDCPSCGRILYCTPDMDVTVKEDCPG